MPRFSVSYSPRKFCSLGLVCLGLDKPLQTAVPFTVPLRLWPRASQCCFPCYLCLGASAPSPKHWVVGWWPATVALSPDPSGRLTSYIREETTKWY